MLGLASGGGGVTQGAFSWADDRILPGGGDPDSDLKCSHEGAGGRGRLCFGRGRSPDPPLDPPVILHPTSRGGVFTALETEDCSVSG